MMYLLTKSEDSIESGAYATMDGDGTPLIQFFVDKDDATTYNELLNAVGYEFHITETPDDSIEKLCGFMGYAYTVAEPGDFVYPRFETMTDSLTDDLI